MPIQQMLHLGLGGGSGATVYAIDLDSNSIPSNIQVLVED